MREARIAERINGADSRTDRMAMAKCYFRWRDHVHLRKQQVCLQ